MRALADCLRRCRRLGVPPTRQIVLVQVAGQRLAVLTRASATGDRPLRGYESGPSSPAPGAQWRPGQFGAAGTASPWTFEVRGSVFDVSRFSFPCSTSRFGIGQAAGTNSTPLGLHRIAQKIGGGWPVGTVFKSRRAIGFTWKGLPQAKITTRILWLEGLEPGVNRGGNVDSHDRYIYIHGTGDETTLGRPASCGCIHLAADNLIPLFDRLPAGTLVWIDR